MDVSAKMVPLKSAVVPSVAELPTCQKILAAVAPPLRTTEAPVPTVSPDAIWKMKTPLLCSVTVPDSKRAELRGETNISLFNIAQARARTYDSSGNAACEGAHCRGGLVRSGRDRLSWRVEMDETYWGSEEENAWGRQLSYSRPRLNLPARNRKCSRGQFRTVPAFLHCLDMNLARFFGRLDDYLRQPVEQRSLRRLVAFLAIRVAVAHANQRARAGDFESYDIVGRRNRPPLLVQDFHLQDGKVLAVCVDLCSVRGKPDGCRRPGCVAPFCQHNFGCPRSARFNKSRLVPYLPPQVPQVRNFLLALALAIHKELHFLQIRVNPNQDFVAFPALEVPVREEMQCRLSAPPGLVVIERVFRKTAHV